MAKVYERRRMARPKFDALQEVSRRSAHVVRPVFVDPATGVLAMEHLPGPTVLRRLGGDGHARALEAAAGWLRDYHLSVPIRGDRNPVDPLARLLATLPRRRWPASIPSLLGSFEARLATARHAPLVLGYTDASPGNIVLTPDGPKGIDRPHAGPGRPETDLARLLHAVAFFRLRQGRPDLISADHAIILAAYAPPALESEALSLALDRDAVHFWIQSRLGRGFHESLSLYLDRWIARLLHELDEGSPAPQA